MNRIKVGRMIISGVIVLIVFLVVEIVIEQLVGRYLFTGIIEEWFEVLTIQDWMVANHVLNIVIVLASSIMVMWLYAALRPMFGVGTKTALIASLFVLTFISAYAINETNLGLYPIQVTLIQLFYWVVELPIAVVAGAFYYEAG